MSTPRPFEIGLFTFGEITANPTTGRFLAQVGLGGLPFEQTPRSIELLATEVLPVVQCEVSRRLKGVV